MSCGITRSPRSNTLKYLEVLAKTYISLIAKAMKEFFLDIHHIVKPIESTIYKLKLSWKQLMWSLMTI